MKKFAVNVSRDGRILSATYPEFARQDSVLVNDLPEGDIYDYLLIDGKFVLNPLKKQNAKRSLEDRISAIEQALLHYGIDIKQERE